MHDETNDQENSNLENKPEYVRPELNVPPVNSTPARSWDRPTLDLKKVTDVVDKVKAEVAKVIIGHDVNFDTKFNITSKKVVESVIFRDPISWEISRYNQHVNRMVMRKDKPISYEFWLKKVNKLHSQFDWLLAKYYHLHPVLKKISNPLKYELIMSCIQNFDNIVLLNNFNSFIKYILDDLKLNNDLTNLKNQNVVGVHKKDYFERTSHNMELISKQTEFDYKCYNYIGANLETTWT